MNLIIDRFEGTYAICEDEEKTIITIPKYKLPLGVKEGDIISIKNGFYQVNTEEIKKKKERVKFKMQKLFQQKNKPEDTEE